ncbi:MAG: polysaccharide deacetylase family protein [Oscillospiraceae bacterium]|nr:polysaccharide deacetylase family protein [Oscillospiraceae bacterium]
MKRILICFALLILLQAVPGLAITSQAGAGDEVEVPIIMYHSLLEKKTNEWNIFPSAFEKDLAYLAESGYTTVGVSELIDYVYHSIPLPEKPIVLTFDDGYYNNYSQGMPLLEKYDMKMVLAVIGKNSDHWTAHANETDERYGHLTWPQIAEMAATGRVELANHTNDLHKNENGRKGCKMKSGEDEAAYRELIAQDLEALQSRIEEHGIARPQSFVYPFGAHCSKADEVLRELGFKVTLSCASGVNHLRVGDEAGLWKMKRNNRTPDNSVEEILRRVADS